MGKRFQRSREQAEYERALSTAGALPGSVYPAVIAAASAYLPSSYDGQIVLFLPTEIDADRLRESVREWGALAARGAEVVRVPGDHAGIFDVLMSSPWRWLLGGSSNRV